MPETIAGVVLAGGRSARMGRSKALLPWGSGRLIDHMVALLKTCAVAEVVVSGEVPGLNSIPDDERHAGPAAALRSVARHIKGHHIGLLAVPVDMPHLTPQTLDLLIPSDIARARAFQNYPLPVFLPISEHLILSHAKSMRDLLQDLVSEVIPLPEGSENEFINVNTPEDWQAIHQAPR